MPGMRRLLLLPRGPRAALPELRRRRAHGQRLRLGAPPLPPHRRPGRPGAGRPRPGAAGAAASPAGEERPGPAAALQRQRLHLGGRHHRDPRGLVRRERAVPLPCSAPRRAGEPGHAEAEPAGAGLRRRPGPRRRRRHGLAPGRVLPRRQRLQRRRLQLRRERHLQGRQREARRQRGGLAVLPLVVGGSGGERAVRPGAGDPVVGAGAPLPADGIRAPLATRRPRQHRLRAGHLLPGQRRPPLLPDHRRRSSKAPEESLALFLQLQTAAYPAHCRCCIQDRRTLT